VKTEGKQPMKRKIEIAFETTQIIVRRGSNKIVEAWCQACGEQVQMVGSEQAVLISGISLRQLVKQIEADQLHYRETEDGLLLICLASLSHQESNKDQIESMKKLKGE
jgi:hypothetical protein